ncbi:MAG: M23 family metallopeptidase [Lachnospiraceae bacterium]|nr:M23 family metallopeptidase [Lachnospiraceae bacterium]
MKKNQFTKWLQNKTVLAALLIVLMAGTAVAGVIAMRSGESKKKPGDDQSGYAFETQEDKDADREQLAAPTTPQVDDPAHIFDDADTAEPDPSEQAVQSDKVDAVLPQKDSDKKKDDNKSTKEADENETDEETLVDAEDAVVYEPENEEDANQPVDVEGAALHFQEGSHIAWPVEGNVILDYSMDSTIYFPTLKQYKCNPGILIQSEVGLPVEAAVRGVVTAVGSDEELGNFVVMDLGGEYSILYGQLKDVTVSVDQLVEAGEVLGYVAEPTKYYVVEGPNMYLEMRHQQDPVDPLDYIR